MAPYVLITKKELLSYGRNVERNWNAQITIYIHILQKNKHFKVSTC